MIRLHSHMFVAPCSLSTEQMSYVWVERHDDALEHVFDVQEELMLDPSADPTDIVCR